MVEDATQQATQQALDPRRTGQSLSYLGENDNSDIICILNPGSPAAFRSVSLTAQKQPQHILNNRFPHVPKKDPSYMNCVLLNAEDIALRFSSSVKRIDHGFCFGRNPSSCDVLLADDPDNSVRRISNAHFLIKPNPSGVLILEDISTNGTYVDDVPLFGKKPGHSNTHILENGSTIMIVSPIPEHKIVFHVRVPSRDGFVPEYTRNFTAYRNRIAQAPSPSHLVIPNASYGMKWDGRPKYSVTGLLGKGAFAMVYQLTTRREGHLFAVKELEKRRYVKDGVLDRKLGNEMEIMKSITHPNIVQYVEYHDIDHYLYIVMEYVPHGDFQHYLKRGPCSEEIGIQVATQTLQALQYLHANNITHRDIKPDNILISSLDPFIIKLSDFGLSKVKKDETFLKTFCGTLLYCAPEVFPHYQAQKIGSKRRHSSKSYSYTHAVDIWSLAGVLWNALSGQPPFEGQVDQTGKAMFDKIMHTPLDAFLLQAKSISYEAQDLLFKMLHTEPELRPTAAQCLRHGWLHKGGIAPDFDVEAGLNMIPEENDEAEKFSQLFIQERPPLRNADSFISLSFIDDHLDAFDAFDVRASRSKRVKPDTAHAHNQVRHDSQPPESFEEPLTTAGSSPKPALKTQDRRLFGEIGVLPLADSTVLGQHVQAVLELDLRPVSPTTEHSKQVLVPGTQGSMEEVSLEGTESLVRHLNMVSPHSDSFSYSLESSSLSSYNQMDPQDNHNMSLSSEETTRAATNAAQSMYESLKSDSTPTRNNRSPLPITAQASTTSLNRCLSPLDVMSKTPKPLPPETQLQWTTTPPKYGSLITTMDSGFSMFLKLDDWLAHYGRNSGCTFRHPDPMDLRVSRAAFIVAFNASNIEKIMESGRDWTQLKDLHVLILNYSRTSPIWVNDVALPLLTDEPISFATRLYSGDVITVFKPNEGNDEFLRFVCDFYYGSAKEKRTSEVVFEQTWSRAPIRQASKSTTAATTTSQRSFK